MSRLVGFGCFVPLRRILDRVTEDPAQAAQTSVSAEREPAGSSITDEHDGAPGDVDGLAQVPVELHRPQPQLGPDFASVAPAGQRAVGDVAHAAVPAWRRLTRGEPRWPVSAVVLLMIALQLRLPGELTPIGRWLLPATELVVLAVLVAANPRRIDRGSPLLRGLGLGLIGVASLANAWSVGLLIDDLVHGSNADDPVPLLASGANIWITNVIIFAVWYWELDRGGPAARAAGTDPHPDFLFPQMSDSLGIYREWEPQFTDYAFVSFTNATAFSPTDTMPMSRWAKLAMMLQAAVSLVTAALVIARAVNILK
jgi:hypothetical protein